MKTICPEKLHVTEPGKDEVLFSSIDFSEALAFADDIDGDLIDSYTGEIYRCRNSNGTLYRGYNPAWL